MIIFFEIIKEIISMLTIHPQGDTVDEIFLSNVKPSSSQRSVYWADCVSHHWIRANFDLLVGLKGNSKNDQ